MNILAIGAHPDDIELGCGGLLIKSARQGHTVHMLTVTKGDVGGDPEKRTRELVQSARYIGAKDLRIGDLQDTKLSANAELIRLIESYVNEVDPDLVVTHSSGDVHHDHRAVATATLEAARFPSNILSYEIPLSRSFEPKVFFDVSDVIDEKVALIQLFKTQRSKLYLGPNAIKSLAEYRALQSRLNTSVNYVEAFDVMKLCLDQDFRLFKVPYAHTVLRMSDDYRGELSLPEMIGGKGQ